MAELTILWETGRHVTGVSGGLVILQMTRHAVRADCGVVASGMTLQAGHGRVGSGKRELSQVVVELSSLPGCSVVTVGTIARDCCRYVIGVGGFGEICEMTANAICLDTDKAIARVAGVACQSLVRTGEGKMGEAGVIETRDRPAVGSVAVLAGRGESGGGVIEDAILLELARVAANALCAESDVAANSRAGMTGIAHQRCVRADQREAIPVILQWPGVYAPAEHGVAALALCAELALVEICVAIRATGAGVGKDSRHVARITRDILVHAAKLKASLRVVIEFGLRPKGGPARSGVTILAGERQLPMRVAYVDLRYRRQRHPQRYRQAA